MPAETGGGEQPGRTLARGAARAQPPLRRAENADAALEVRRLLVGGLIRRNDVLRPAVRGDRMACLANSLHQLGITLGDDAADIPDRAYPAGRKHVDELPRPGLRPVFGPRARLQVEHAGLERVAHRPDPRRRAVAPTFEHDVDRNRQALSLRPSLGQRCCVHRFLHANSDRNPLSRSQCVAKANSLLRRRGAGALADP